MWGGRGGQWVRSYSGSGGKAESLMSRYEGSAKVQIMRQSSEGRHGDMDSYERLPCQPLFVAVADVGVVLVPTPSKPTPIMFLRQLIPHPLPNPSYPPDSHSAPTRTCTSLIHTPARQSYSPPHSHCLPKLLSDACSGSLPVKPWSLSDHDFH